MKLYGRDLLYCIGRKTFFNWDGRRWNYSDFRAVEILADRTLHYSRALAWKMADAKAQKAAGP